MNMKKYVEIYCIYSNKEQEIDFKIANDILNNDILINEAYFNKYEKIPNSNKLWFIGLKLWGDKFSREEYNQREKNWYRYNIDRQFDPSRNLRIR